MIRFPSGEDDDNVLPEEQRFYYLRLMAKPSDDKREPIKTKFVRWAPPCPQHNSVESDHDLESQAMRVVRTIGQAFEVCHKVAQEQMQEKHQEDSESGLNVKGKSSVVSVEGDHAEVEEKLAKVSEASRSPSPTDDPPPPAPTAPAYLQKRHSIFVPRKASEPALSLNTAMEKAASSTTAALKDYAQPSTSGEQQKLPSGPAPPMQQCSVASGNPSAATGNPVPFASGSSTLPHSMTWGPQIPGQFQSMQSLDQRGLPMPYYPMPMVGPSVSMPYGLSSPYLLSPYATMQLPRNTSEQQIPATNPNIPGSPPEGQDLTAYQLSLSLDQYNQHLIRSQLDQAQQTAQVASCQVQLLRDQLTSETTARIEAQSRTHQLLNANRELLEQVQALVLRLQSLEARLAEEIQEHITQPSTSKGPPSSATLPKTARAAASASRPTSQMTTHSFHEQYTSEAKVPGPPPIDPSKPYQLQSLADIRAGSLPPQGAETGASSSVKNRRAADDSGIRTEPESGAEDTTDYSSSDQYEKVPSVKHRPAAPSPPPGPHLNILMSNPQVMPNLSSFFSSQPSLPGTYIPDYLTYTTRSQNPETNKGDEEQQTRSSPARRMRDRSAVLGGEISFNRMSFNPRLWEGKRRETFETVEGPVMESIEESQAEEQPKGTDERQEDINVRQRRSEKIERFRMPFPEEPGTSSPDEGRFHPEDIGGVERPNKLASPRQEFSETIRLEPASLHVATAMYPPRRSKAPLQSAISKVESPRKTPLRTLSSDIRDQDMPRSIPTQQRQQPSLLMGNGPISLPQSSPQLGNHIHIEAVNEKKQQKLDTSSGLSQMLVLQEALKHGLASTRQQLRKTNETLDGMRSPRLYMESQKQKLSDPTVLAKLTKLPAFRSGADSSKKAFESTSPAAVSKPTTTASNIHRRQSDVVRKSDAGNL